MPPKRDIALEYNTIEQKFQHYDQSANVLMIAFSSHQDIRNQDCFEAIYTALECKAIEQNISLST